MIYDILVSKSCLLTDISDQLHETTCKENTVKRLSNYLSTGTPASATAFYLHTVEGFVPLEPVVLINKSNVVKPDKKPFEVLGFAGDGAESTLLGSEGIKLRDKCPKNFYHTRS